MGIILEYLWAVFSHWWWLMTALLFAIDKTLEWVFPAYRTWLAETFPEGARRKFFWGTLLIFVFLSGFLAWRDEHIKVVEQQGIIAQQVAVTRNAIDAQEEVARLRSETRELRKVAQGWQLSEEEKRILMEKLSDLAPQEVAVWYDRSDGLARVFAENLKEMFLTLPEWKVSGAYPIEHDAGSGKPRLKEVQITASDQEEMPPAAYIIRDSLRKENVPCSLDRQPPSSDGPFVVSPGVLRIIVWSHV